MRIYSMTATFGKLENQTITLQPGLNVISAPNEWGKSTWCTFLVTMLYGLDTREKTTKTTLAVKERYAPWSGSPMSGRMDIQWNGRDITLERWTKGRTPMGEFRAYETSSGLAVPELTASNCGEMLLGVEKSVFVRSGFLRLADLPVTADESLRRRLNALVTTGDESGAADELAQKLKDLKNKCRYNRSGLLPQAEEQRKGLEAKLAELQDLQVQSAQLQQRKQSLQAKLDALNNHKVALAYAAAQANIRRVEQAREATETAAQQVAQLETRCAKHISREEAEAQLQQYAQLQNAGAALLQQRAALPPEPVAPQIDPRYQQCTAAQAAQQADADARAYATLAATKKKRTHLWWIYGVVAALLLVAAALVGSTAVWIGAGAAVVLGGVGLLGFCKAGNARIDGHLQSLLERYPGLQPQQWAQHAIDNAQAWQQYQKALAENRQQTMRLADDLRRVQEQITALTGNMDIQSWHDSRNAILADHDALAEAYRQYRAAADHAAALQAVVKPVAQPEGPDDLTLSEAETVTEIGRVNAELGQYTHLQGQYQGRMEVLGSRQTLQTQLDVVNTRIEKLEQTYSALDLALRTLEKATAELQRRFAPRIAQQASELFAKLTGGRYDRLIWQQDLAVHAGATDEIALHSAQWRSEGTIDQLYLALRLAVARELTPKAPLVLDDALVRFDDQRHAAAMEILRQEAEEKQVILFTCQSRETA